MTKPTHRYKVTGLMIFHGEVMAKTARGAKRILRNIKPLSKGQIFSATPLVGDLAIEDLGIIEKGGHHAK